MNASVGGGIGLKGVGLQSFMGKHHIHDFYGAFAAKGIITLTSLRALPVKEIMEICTSANMPPPAIDRLLEESGIRKKKQTTQESKATKPNVKPIEDKEGQSGTKYNYEMENKNSQEVRTEKSKTEVSSYYHF